MHEQRANGLSTGNLLADVNQLYLMSKTIPVKILK